MLLSFGAFPGRHGGNVNAIEDCLEDRLGSLWKETLDRPPSIVNVARCETFVRLGSAALMKDNITTRLLEINCK